MRTPRRPPTGRKIILCKRIALIALIGGQAATAFGNDRTESRIIDRRQDDILFVSIANLKKDKDRIATLADQAAKDVFPFNCDQMDDVKDRILKLNASVKTGTALPESEGDLWEIPKEPSPRHGLPGSCEELKAETVAKRETLISTLKSWQAAADSYAKSTNIARSIADTLKESENDPGDPVSCVLDQDERAEDLAKEIKDILRQLPVKPERSSGCARAVNAVRDTMANYLNDLTLIRATLAGSLQYVSQENLLERAKRIDCVTIERQREKYRSANKE